MSEKRKKDGRAEMADGCMAAGKLVARLQRPDISAEDMSIIETYSMDICLLTAACKE